MTIQYNSAIQRPENAPLENIAQIDIGIDPNMKLSTKSCVARFFRRQFQNSDFCSISSLFPDGL